MNTNITEQSRLRLFAKGLPQYEQKVVEATAKISRTRPLAIFLVNEPKAKSADVIVIDGKNAEALTWAKQNLAWLREKTVIWIDVRTKFKGHITLNRPVLWVNLPIIISRVLDDIEIEKVANQIPSGLNKNNSDTVTAKAHILICDDSQAVRSHLSTLLGEKQYRTTAVDSGEAAVAAVHKQQFDCVLMDILMPGMDGYRACREILRSPYGKRLPVIMLTGKTSPFDKIRGKMSGCSAYLTKPVTMRELLQTIERYTQKK